MVFPLNVIELPLQIDCVMFVVGDGFIVVVKTIKLSHPKLVDKVSRYTPAVVMVFPLNVIELPLQIDCVIFVVDDDVIETVNTIKLSQPKLVINVSRYTPAVVMVLPLNVIELPLQIDCVIFVVGDILIVVVKTIKLSQPKLVVKVSR